MHDAAVIAEVIVAQLGKAVEAEAANDERVEMADEKIGEVERARLVFGERRERLLAGIEGVAMRAFDAAHPLFREHAIELAAGAAIAIEAEDLVVGCAIGADLRPHRLRDSLGMVVQLRRQAGDVDGVELEREHFARQRAAGDDQDAARPAGGRAIASSRNRRSPSSLLPQGEGGAIAFGRAAALDGCVAG